MKYELEDRCPTCRRSYPDAKKPARLNPGRLLIAEDRDGMQRQFYITAAWSTAQAIMYADTLRMRPLCILNIMEVKQNA